MQIGVVTLFPEMLDALRHGGITGRAIERGIVTLGAWNPRDFSCSPQRAVDDRPYGGGPGMVMQVHPVRGAIRAARAALGGAARVIYLTPQGRRLDQAGVAGLATLAALVLVCGRYEGVDERVVSMEIDTELSIGDYVLSGGELAAMVVVDAVTRLLPGALGHADSAREDSFAGGLLDCPHYTRPECVDGMRVPSVLLSGDHEAIRRWRLKQALGRTWLRRRDLLDGVRLDDERRALLAEFVAEQAREAK